MATILDLSPVNLTNFKGGLNNRDADNKIADNEAREIKNFDIVSDGSLKKRAGSLKYNSSEIAGSNPVHSLYRYYQSVAASKEFLSISGSTLYKGNDGTGVWSSVGSVTASTPATFLTWKDIAYLANGTVFNQYNGTTMSVVSGSPKIGRYLALRKDRIYIAGIPAEPNTLYFSDVDDATSWTIGSNFIQIREDDGDIITGILSLREQLIIYKRNSIWSLHGFTNDPSAGTAFFLTQIAEGVGCVSPQSLVEFNNIHYFLHRTGVYAFDGANSVKISGKIDPIIDGTASTDALRQDYMDVTVGTIHKEKYWLSYTALTELANKRVMVFDTRPDFNGWTLYHEPLNIASFNNWGGGNDVGELYGGDSEDGFVRQLDTGTDDDGSDIEAFYKSKFFDFGNPATNKETFIAYNTAKPQAVGLELTMNADRGVQTSRLLFDLTGDSFLLGTSMLGVDAMGSSGAKYQQQNTENIAGHNFSLELQEKGALGVEINSAGFLIKNTPFEG